MGSRGTSGVIAASLSVIIGSDSGSGSRVGRQPGAIEEVIVTAREREETLQETPLSVTASPPI